MPIDINKFSKREKNLVGMLLIVLASLPFFMFTIPAWKELSLTTKKINDSKLSEKRIDKQIGTLDQLRKDSEKLQKQIDVRRAFLAKSYEIDFLVQDLKTICDESSVTLESFTPTEPEPINIVLARQAEAEIQGTIKNSSELKETRKRLKGQNLQVDLYRFPIEVKVTGNFSEILELLKKLEKYGRVISVEDISISKIQAKKGGGNRLSKSTPVSQITSDGSLYGSFDLVAYSLPDENEVLPFSSLERSTQSTFKIKKKKPS